MSVQGLKGTASAADSEQVKQQQQQILVGRRRFSVDGYDHAELLGQQTLINWSKYVGAGQGKDENLFVTPADVEFIKEFEGSPEAAVQELVDTQPESASGYAQALLKVVRNFSEETVLTYTLTLMEDFLVPNISVRSKFFASTARGTAAGFDLSPLLRAIRSDNRFVREKSAYITALLLSVNPSSKADVDAFLTWVVEQLRASQTVAEKAMFSASSMASAQPAGSTPDQATVAPGSGKSLRPSGHSSTMNPVTLALLKESSLRAALASLSAILRNRNVRPIFAEHGGVKLLFPLLQPISGSPQALYELIFAIWETSFSVECLPFFNAPALNSIVSVVKSKPRDKVLRLAIATLCNVIKGQPNEEKQVCEILIGLDLMRALDTIESQRINDPEATQDIKWIKEMILKNYRVLTTFESYEQELATGQLKPGALHEDRFWKDFAKRFESNDFILIRKLVDLLTSSNDPDTLALACSDLGYFVQFYPNGKKIATTLEAKKKIMLLLAHPNQMVQKNALLSCSKMMVSNWESIKG